MTPDGGRVHSRPRVRVGAMIWSGENLLLVRQGRPGRPRWMLPGGGVEPGEDLEHTLERELAEEVSITECEVLDPVALVESIAPPSASSRRHLIHMIFHVACESNALACIEAIDPAVREVRMVHRDELLRLPLHPPIAGFLQNWKPGHRFAYLGSLWAP